MLRPADTGRLSGYDATSMARSAASHCSILLAFAENRRRTLDPGLSNIAQQRTTTRSSTCRPGNVTRSLKKPLVNVP